MTSAKISSPAQRKLYFAYGSNLSLTQMANRCPESSYYSLAVLKKYRWIINDRGYANILPSNEENLVYGLLFWISTSDEETLDRAEGVPSVYEKHIITVSTQSVEGKASGEVKVLVYVDVTRVREGVCREEYVARMNRGIKDAVAKGMPMSYVKDVLRRFVPEEELKGEKIEDPFLIHEEKNSGTSSE
jgi:gamma-glutamylcyclotransferase